MASKLVPDVFYHQEQVLSSTGVGAGPAKVFDQGWWQFFRQRLNDLQASSTFNTLTHICAPIHLLLIYTLVSQWWRPGILAAGWGADSCFTTLTSDLLPNPPASGLGPATSHKETQKWFSHSPASEHLLFIHSIHKHIGTYEDCNDSLQLSHALVRETNQHINRETVVWCMLQGITQCYASSERRLQSQLAAPWEGFLERGKPGLMSLKRWIGISRQYGWDTRGKEWASQAEEMTSTRARIIAIMLYVWEQLTTTGLTVNWDLIIKKHRYGSRSFNFILNISGITEGI